MIGDILTVWGQQMKVPKSRLFGSTGARCSWEAFFLYFCCSKLKPKSQQSTQTVYLQSCKGSSRNLSPRLKYVPGVRLDRYHPMKVNDAKNKTALLLRTTLLMCTEKICKSKATDTETQTSLSCVLDCIYSLAQACSRGCVLYLTPGSTRIRPWHFKLKKLTIPIFTVQWKAINGIPVDTRML